MREKVGRLENLNKSYRVLLMSMAMAKGAIRDSSMCATGGTMKDMSYDSKRTGARFQDEVRSKSLLDERVQDSAGWKDRELRSEMRGLKAKGERYLGLQGKIEKGLRDGFLKVWNLGKDGDRSEDGVTRKIELDESDLDMEKTRALVDFGSTTISRILCRKNVQSLPSKSRRDQSASSARSKGSRKSENEIEASFITSQKESVSHIV